MYLFPSMLTNIPTAEDASEEMLGFETLYIASHIPHGELRVWPLYTALYC